jgi:hypothetical protein
MMQANIAITDYTHPSVCKDFLAGLCVQDLFHGEFDVSPCPLIHSTAFYDKYQKEGKWKGDHYEQQLFRKLELIQKEVQIKVHTGQVQLSQPYIPAARLEAQRDQERRIMEIDLLLQNVEKMLEMNKDPPKELVQRLKEQRHSDASALDIDAKRYQTIGQAKNITMCKVCGVYLHNREEHAKDPKHNAYKSIQDLYMSWVSVYGRQPSRKRMGAGSSNTRRRLHDGLVQIDSDEELQ